MTSTTRNTITNGQRMRPYALILGVLIVAEATGAFENAMLTVAIPTIMTDYAVTAVEIGWAVAGFFLVAGASALVGGRLGDLFGRRRVLIATLVISGLGSLICLMFGSFEAVVIGRSIQGVSGAVLPLLMGLVRETVDERRTPVAIAIVSGTYTIAAALGFFVSGILVDSVGWHAIFIVSTSLALVAGVGSFLLPRSAAAYRRGDRIDLLGGLLLVPALAALLYGVSISRTLTWFSPVTWAWTLGGLALVGVWAVWELRQQHPMINLRLLRRRQFALTMLMIAAYSIGPFGGFLLLQPVMLQYPADAPVGLGLTASVAGLVSLVSAVLSYGLAPLSGVLARRRGARAAALIGAAVTLATLPVMLFFHTNAALVITSIVVAGLAATFTITAIPNLVAESVPAANMSEGTGFYVVVRSVFQSVSVSIVGMILASSVVPGTQNPTVDVFAACMTIMFAGTAGALVCVLLMRRRAVTASTEPVGNGTPAVAAATPESAVSAGTEGL